MEFSTYKFLATLLDDAILPPYKGSTFRGGFGGCLKRAVCAVKQKDCPDCLLSSRCIYARLFESIQWDTPDNARTAAQPHPYIIQPPESIQTRYHAGDQFEFNLLLFGEMNTYLPYFVYTFELMGEQGIGKKTGEHRARFSLCGVTNDDTKLYDPRTGKLSPAPAPDILEIAAVEPTSRNSGITITLQTPLRLKGDNHLQSNLQFSLLTRAMLRRVSGLFNAWGKGEPALDYRGMVARAADVKVVDSRLHWHDWERWSNRQEKAMNFGGMMGSVTYQGPLDEYMPLIKLCEKLHLGKQTAFGLGRFRVEELKS